MKKAVYTLLAVIGLSFSGVSQGTSDLQLSINYNIGIPMGEFSDFINKGSFRGINLQLDYYLNDKMSIGGYIGWNGFYQKKERSSYEFDGGAINGQRYNYLYQLPLYVKFQYLFIDQGTFSPYAAIGVGGHYIEQEAYVGYVGFATNTWAFGTAPELGTYMMLGQSGWSAKIAGIYHLSFYDKNNISTLQNLGINLGFNYDF